MYFSKSRKTGAGFSPVIQLVFLAIQPNIRNCGHGGLHELLHTMEAVAVLAVSPLASRMNRSAELCC